MKRTSTAKYAVCLIMTYAFLPHPDLQAQRRPATLDGTMGVWTAQTKESYSTRGGFLFGATFVAPHQTSRIFAVSGGLSFPVGENCVVATQGASCAPDFPALAHIAVAGGLESGTDYGTGRVTLGPAFYLSRTSGQSSGIGGQLTADVAGGVKYLKVLAGVRYTLLFRRSEIVGMPEGEIGVRLGLPPLAPRPTY